MRVTMALPLAAAFVLAACGSSSSSDANGDGKISTQEAASAAAKMDAPRPGKYKTTVNLLDFTMPGMPAAMLERLKGSMTSNMTTTFCQTGDNRKQAIKDMTDAMGRGNCTYNSLDISGNNFDVDMSCTSPQGITGHYKVNGTVGSEGTDMTMEITQDMPQGGGQMHMKTHAVSTRIGDCGS